MIAKPAFRHVEALLQRLALRPPRAVATDGIAVDAGTATTDAGDTRPLEHRPWLSVPLATALVAGLMAVFLSIDVVGTLDPAPQAVQEARIAAADPTTAGIAASSPIHQSSESPTAVPALAPDRRLEAALALAVMPEPAAGPAGEAVAEGNHGIGGGAALERMPGGTSWLPVVPEVPAELDDIARELQRRRAEVLELEAGLAVREAALRAAEADLSAQIDRLEAFRRQLEALVGEAEAEEAERMDQLVRMYESMRAKSAAAIFDRLEMPVILAVAKRMREARMAAILAAMDPNRARIVTSELARERELPRLD